MELRSALGLLLLVQPATAESASGPSHRPSNGTRAWPALVRLSVPTPASQTDRVLPLSIAASAGYGYIESSGEPGTETHRVPASLALSFAPSPAWTFQLDVSSRIDAFTAPDQGVNLYGEPRLGARYVIPGLSALDLGVEADVRFVGGAAPDLQADATSPSFSLLLGRALGSSTYISGLFGLHLDFSENTDPDPQQVSATDRVTMSASCCPALRFGVGASQRFSQLQTEWLGEIWAEPRVGAGAPSVFESPWNLSFGARHPLAESWSAQGVVDFGLSARPAATTPVTLVPATPRFAAQLTLIWTPKKRQQPPPAPVTVTPPAKEEAAPPPPPPPPPPAPVQRSAVTGLIVDEAGQGVADVALLLVFPDGQTIQERTFADGTFSFADVPENVPVRIEVQTAGYDTAKIEFGAGSGRHREVVLYPALPAGQVRGSILDLKGNPVQATVTLEPDGTKIEVTPEGAFELELPPGRHILKFEHEGFAPQQRVVEVQERGVVILNIALSP